jgi:tetratricopeptide (TPR) repeat protein
MRWLVASVCGLSLLTLPALLAAQTPGRTLVVPFDNVSQDPRIVWLGEAAAILVADDLNALGGEVITREERVKALEQLQVQQAASLTDATIIRIGQLVGAAQVIVGTLRLEDEGLLVQARAIALDAARVQSRASERGAMADIFGLFDRVSRRLVPPGVRPAAAAPAHPPIAAFENYIKGLLAETPATAIGYLSTALQVDGGFDRARLALWDEYDEQGEHEKALAAAVAVPSGSPLSRRARFLAGLSQLNLDRYAEAFAAFKALADEHPTAVLMNNLGVVQLRRGATPAAGVPTYYFNRAADLDRSDPDYFFNLGYAYWLEHDTQAAVYWLREAVRRDPADGDAHYVLGTALTAAGNATEAAREKELARRLSSTYSEWDKRPAADPIPKGLERIHDDIELPGARRIDDTLARGGQRDQQELSAFYLERGRRLYQQEQDREALTELGRAVFLSPYQAEAHLLIGHIHLRGGHAREAIDAFKISLWSADTAEAHAALAAAYAEVHEADAARAEAQRALQMNPSSAEAKSVLDRLATP